MRNCAASAPQATRKADSSMLGNVQSAASAAPPPCIAAASSFRVRTGVQDTMAREHFHESHTEVPAPVASGISFQELVHEMLEQLGEDPTREGWRQTPARGEASLKWRTRGYGMHPRAVLGDAPFDDKPESTICARELD